VAAVEQCPYRTDVESDAAGDEFAECGLLRALIGGGATRTAAFRVGRDACETCCRSTLPSLDRLNPVVASFLYTLTAEIIEQGGVPDCSLAKAETLQAWAGRHLKVELSDAQRPPVRPRRFDACRHLGGVCGARLATGPRGMIREPVYVCLHPDHRETTEAECRSCRDWTDAPRGAQTRLEDWFGRPAARDPSRAWTWAVGITTTARPEPTLASCHESLVRAGWDESIRLFVDGHADAPGDLQRCDVTVRAPAVGAWPNYYLSLQELVLRHPQADALLLVQDDALFYDREDVRAYLEATLRAGELPGVVSLYSSAANAADAPGWHRADSWEWGALAFIFPRALAIRFLTDPQVLRHRFTNRGLKYIDDVIGEWAARTGTPLWHPWPSLVQHIGTTSTLWPEVPAAGFRRADAFAGDL
jgi:hypothetical protein